MDLNNKVAVIAGGASGLGRATAEMVINQGGKVALFDLNQDLVAQTAKELGPMPAELPSTSPRRIRRGRC